MVLTKATTVKQQEWKPFWNLLKSKFSENVEVAFTGQSWEPELRKDMGEWGSSRRG